MANETNSPSDAAAIQRLRDEQDLTNHRARLEWLSNESPRWSCGALVDCHTRNVLLLQSRAVVARATGA